MATQFTLQKTFKTKNTKHREGRKAVFINKVQEKSQFSHKRRGENYIRERTGEQRRPQVDPTTFHPENQQSPSAGEGQVKNQMNPPKS